MRRKYTGFLQAQIPGNVTAPWFLLSKRVTRPAPSEGVGRETLPLEENMKVIRQEVWTEGGSYGADHGELPQPVSAPRLRGADNSPALLSEMTDPGAAPEPRRSAQNPCSDFPLWGRNADALPPALTF